MHCLYFCHTACQIVVPRTSLQFALVLLVLGMPWAAPPSPPFGVLRPIPFGAGMLLDLSLIHI